MNKQLAPESPVRLVQIFRPLLNQTMAAFKQITPLAGRFINSSCVSLILVLHAWSCEVQFGQRLAFSGIFEIQYGHSFIEGAG